jgi:uncharacterized protein (DUF983 family)
MLRTTLLGRCPACEEGRIFRGVFAMHRECPACGAVLERNEGNFTGPVVIGYTAGAVAAFVVGFLLYWRLGDRPWLEYAVALTAAAAALLAYRPAKAWFVWLLWATGLVFRDSDPTR